MIKILRTYGRLNRGQVTSREAKGKGVWWGEMSLIYRGPKGGNRGLLARSSLGAWNGQMESNYGIIRGILLICFSSFLSVSFISLCSFAGIRRIK